MHRIVLSLFLIFPLFSLAQNLQLNKATEQTIKHGASPTATTNYYVLLKKSKSFKWSVDSVYSVADNKKVNYNIVKVDNPDLTSPNYQKLEKFEKKYKGLIQLTFASTKSMGGGGRPNAPKLEIGEQNDYSAGVIIYYTAKKNKKELKIESFVKLEMVNAP